MFNILFIKSNKMSKSKTIDYLFEDPEISNQRYALISIVGPHMQQKCDVWGLKIRGVAETIDKARSLCKKLLGLDNNYDIYTVEVGKFFPLAVEPNEVQDIEYQNDQLNTLVKSYLENRQNANEMWHKRKVEMIEQAVKEGKNQEEFANKPEHPIAILQRIRNYEETLNETEESLKSLREDLERSKAKFECYTEEEKEIALKEFKTALETSTNNKVSVSEDKPFTVEEIRNELQNTMNDTNKSINVESIIEKIKLLEQELLEMNEFKKTISQTASPRGYDKIVSNIADTERQLKNLKDQLNNKDLVNSYINNNYPEYHFE
jgi:uncharacterized protein (UPF0335 family)